VLRSYADLVALKKALRTDWVVSMERSTTATAASWNLFIHPGKPMAEASVQGVVISAGETNAEALEGASVGV